MACRRRRRSDAGRDAAGGLFVHSAGGGFFPCIILPYRRRSSGMGRRKAPVPDGRANAFLSGPVRGMPPAVFTGAFSGRAGPGNDPDRPRGAFLPLAQPGGQGIGPAAWMRRNRGGAMVRDAVPDVGSPAAGTPRELLCHQSSGAALSVSCRRRSQTRVQPDPISGPPAGQDRTGYPQLHP